MDKKISIIIPVYNVEKYIEKCLESVVNQSYRNIEIIIIIDGSKDNSIEMVNKFVKSDDRIILINRENKGVMYTRLEGVRIASGEFIMFVDADDWIDTEMCAILLKNQKKYDCDIVKASYYLAKENKNIPFEFIKENMFIDKKEYKNTIYKKILDGYSLNNMWGQLIRKSLAIEIVTETNINLAEDLNYNLELYTKSKNILLINDNLYYYRINFKSETRTVNYEKIQKHIEDIILVYGKLYEYIKVWELDNDEIREKISLRILKEITAKTLFIYRAFKLENKQIDNILNFVVNNDILNRINRNLERKNIMNINYNKKFTMKAIYDRKIWKINLYGKVVIHNEYILRNILRKFKII